jgi:hypothetical protein
LRSFFPQELDLLVRSQGFEAVEKFGNFERKAFGSGDPKQVVVCKSKWQSEDELDYLYSLCACGGAGKLPAR